MSANIELFEETKSALLRHYSEQQTSQGTRLIGFAVSFFTLIQTVQVSYSDKLAEVFAPLNQLPLPSFAVVVKPLLLLSMFSIASILMIFIVRTVFRFAAVAILIQSLLELPPTTNDANQSLTTVISNRMREEFEKRNAKLYWLFPATWFVKRDSDRGRRENRNGWCLSLSIAVFLNLILFMLLW